MYNHFQIAAKYLKYYITSANGKGHGIHSPFVFEWVTKVAGDKKNYPVYDGIEKLRDQLRKDERIIEVEDFGAGSTVIKSSQRKVRDIARSSLKSPKLAQLLFRMVQYYQPLNIVELGTSLGVTSAYLASGNRKATLFTCEGSSEIASIADTGFKQLGLKNIELVEGDFNETLPGLLQKMGRVDFAFVDGNHRYAPTINYFNALLAHSTNNTILIFDDIHWSVEMEAAWKAIQQDPAVTLTIDLFFIGIVCLNNDIKIKQDFIILY